MMVQFGLWCYVNNNGATDFEIESFVSSNVAMPLLNP